MTTLWQSDCYKIRPEVATNLKRAIGIGNNGNVTVNRVIVKFCIYEYNAFWVYHNSSASSENWHFWRCFGNNFIKKRTFLGEN